MKKEKQNSLRRIHMRKEYFWVFFLFFSFFMIFFLMSGIIYWNTSKSTRKELETEIAHALNQAESEWEKSTQKIYEAGYNMLNNEAFSKLLAVVAKERDPVKSGGLISWMKNYAGGTSQYSGENFIYFDNQYVITDEGVADFTLYFDVLRPHSRCTLKDWEQLLESAPHYKMMPMDTVTEKYSGRQQQVVLPVVLSKNLHDSKVVLVTEIQADRVQAMFEDRRTLKDQVFLCMDQEQNVFFNTADKEPTLQEKEMLSKMLEASPMMMQEMGHGRKGYLAAGIKGALGLDYFVFTPLEQMHGETFARNQFMLLFFLLTMVIFFILTLVYTRRVYHPLRNVVQKLSQMQIKPEYTGWNFKEELDQLCAGSTEILAHQQELILESFNEAVRAMLHNGAVWDNRLCVEHLLRIGADPQNLACAMLRIRFCKKYYTDFSEEERSLVEENMPGILVRILASSGLYAVQDDAGSRCVCFFSKEKTDLEKLEEAIQCIRLLLSNDEDYCRVETGIAYGSCHSDADVRRLLWQAATAMHMPPEGRNTISVYNEKQVCFELQFTQKERNRITHLLTVGEEESLIELVDEIVERNQNANVHEALLQLLHQELYHIGYEYLMISGKGNPEQEKPIWSAVLCAEDSAARYSRTDAVKEFYKKCIALTQESQKADDTLEAILTYVREHFAENIYVETVGEAMGFHPKYLSRVFKERTGINMSEYITLVRITKAKELLENSEKSVGEIGEEVGFENRTTFFRSFKKLEGISPNEYRKISRQMKQ